MTTQPVTEREAQVLALLADRLSNAQIAHRLHISVRTVEHHVSALLRKFGADDRRTLAELARRHRVGGRRLAGLPRPHTSFVGRAAERDLVRAALDGSRLVTLVGPGGVGKTRLAVAVAEAVAPASGNRGGFVDLVPVRDGFVAPAVAAVLGVAQRPHQPLSDTIAEHLGDRPALLVLDNCEHVLDGVAELVTGLLAACPAVLVLTTSRERLRLPGEQSVPVEPLPVADEAVALFQERAAAADPRFGAEPATLARICARLDGMPLAIELAAARVAALGTQGLMTALDDAVRVLTGGRTPDPRHRSLRAVIDWSHDLLDEAEQALFRCLAVFVGPFDLSAATAVADAGDTIAVADLLGRLVDKNLVVLLPGSGRWRLLDTIRAYARQRLAADERAAVRRRHLEWAQAVATALEDRLNEDWSDEFDAVVDDLRAALREVPPGPDDIAHRLARSLGRLTYARQLRQEAVDRYRQAARNATTAADAAADLATAADCAAVTYRADLAFELLLDAADKAGQAGDGDTRAALLSRAVQISCRYPATFAVAIPRDRLLELHREATATANPDNSRTTAALAINAAWLAGPPSPDPTLAERALATARAAHDPVLVWAAIDTAASVYERQGHLRRAHELVRAEVPLLAELDRNEPWAGATVRSIHYLGGVLAIAAGDLPAAIEAARAAATDPITAEPMALGSLLVPPLVLSGDFEEALRHADAMWHAWEAGGRAVAGRLWFPAATAALAHGLSGDPSGFRLWRNRMSNFAGPHNAYRLRTASSARFADARMAVHTGDLVDAAAVVDDAFSDPAPSHRYRVFAQAAAAELAVVAGLPDAHRYLDSAAGLAAENGWAAACLARALGRYHRDPDAMRESIDGWERIGARFEHAYTVELFKQG